MGLREESVELAAGRVEGTLLVFPSVVNERTAALIDYAADKSFRGELSQRGLFVDVADDLSAEKPHIVDVVLDGSFRQTGLGEVKEEGHEVFHKLSADRKILFLAHPTLRPLRKITAIAAVGQERNGGQWERIGIRLHLRTDLQTLMRLPRILNQCHPIPGFVYGRASFAQDEQAVLIPVRPRKRSAAICSGCHQPAPGYDQSPTPRRFEFIGFWGYLVFLVYCMRRVNCKQCGVLVEEVPWGMGKHTSTKVHMHFLGHWARKLSWKETAEEFRTSWDKVHDAVAYLVTWGLEHRVLGAIRAIGVDEIQRGKGHKYLTLVYQIDLGCTRLLWIGKERTVKTFKEFFTMIGPEVSAKIEFVCSDMWKPYLGVIREKCAQALNILDRFHIVAKVNKALDDIRSAEARRMKGDGYEPVLTKSRWCLLKRPANLTANQKVKLKDLVRYNLQSVRAYLLKEDFQQLWNYESTAWAAKFLDQWCRQVMRSRIEPMKKVARTLRAHRELILNYFRARKEFSSGVIEGLNNKAKVTMRKSYGFRTFRVTELALYHSLGKLPEPELTHRFF
jgi:transposase